MAKLFKQYPFSPYKSKDFFWAKHRNENKNALYSTDLRLAQVNLTMKHVDRF